MSSSSSSESAARVRMNSRIWHRAAGCAGNTFRFAMVPDFQIRQCVDPGELKEPRYSFPRCLKDQPSFPVEQSGDLHQDAQSRAVHEGDLGQVHHQVPTLRRDVTARQVEKVVGVGQVQLATQQQALPVRQFLDPQQHSLTPSRWVHLVTKNPTCLPPRMCSSGKAGELYRLAANGRPMPPGEAMLLRRRLIVPTVTIYTTHRHRGDRSCVSGDHNGLPVAAGLGSTLQRTPPSRAGYGPASWALVACLLAATGGPMGRRAALRALASPTAAGVAANILLKPLVQRPRPPGSRKGIGPLTSSFPSGHAATEVAFALAAAQELPGLLLPLVAATVAGQVSMVRTRAHHLGDVAAGSVIGLATAGALWKLWPPTAPGPRGASASRGGAGSRP